MVHISGEKRREKMWVAEVWKTRRNESDTQFLQVDIQFSENDKCV